MDKLVFVYNADAGLHNAILDSARKILSPKTYDCKLCDITYGVFAENSAWKKFRKNTDLKMDFLHKDEFIKVYKSKFGHKFTFPIILAELENGLEVFIKTEELNGLENAQNLIDLIQDRKKLY